MEPRPCSDPETSTAPAIQKPCRTSTEQLVSEPSHLEDTPAPNPLTVFILKQITDLRSSPVGGTPDGLTLIETLEKQLSNLNRCDPDTCSTAEQAPEKHYAPENHSAIEALPLDVEVAVEVRPALYISMSAVR